MCNTSYWMWREQVWGGIWWKAISCLSAGSSWNTPSSCALFVFFSISTHTWRRRCDRQIHKGAYNTALDMVYLQQTLVPSWKSAAVRRPRSQQKLWKRPSDRKPAGVFPLSGHTKSLRPQKKVGGGEICLPASQHQTPPAALWGGVRARSSNMEAGAACGHL